ncbi:hypothetical protein A2348_03400 [Candidatus Uhrbacteria bacterium RIFOXYB12_FULL_58_10]|uniref:Methyltransferase domain-containing protein n=1 Tax=Candidatus Uhrbacteria bacterium RIFOXYB2_FULL_57_15 TaxID=1802422 RepID=A0A1F7W5M4_9BACT|nr:MAG: hypothetical protein A2348_03400 [Candidatus Uhrbacteria bacterium RIFOXYB12_FULL_58_10]OGL98112.1 MAG: hypothetical protein A2304_03450 [Candidatus Uhrbacteria bacterium RIFOXYB2_FULL_57_15]OGM00096.1 MAG: hypothetical protein A2501_01105 [Candidatus Uhrbacteria bacterium RIFOXYC12_FULL_57_11]
MKDIYVAPRIPYDAWLRLSNEKDLLLERLPAILRPTRFGSAPGRKRVLDVGCGTGHASLRVLSLFDSLGIPVMYVAADPYQEQLDRFRDAAAHRSDVTFLRARLEDIPRPPIPFDLVIASHSLYYLRDWPRSIPYLLSLGNEALIVHHGSRGIDEVHRRFSKLVRDDAHIVSTCADLAPHLPGAAFHAFASSVNVSSCHDPNSPDGHDLLSFFLMRDAGAIQDDARSDICAWFRHKFPDGRMTHDVGVFVLTQP